MTILNLSVTVSWLAILTVWFAFAINSKRTIRTSRWWWGTWIRVAVVIVVLLLLHTSLFVQHGLFDQIAISTSPNLVSGTLGALLCVTGIAFAIWARVHLGRNWGMPMSLKEKPDLVMSGPYRFVRHPIYTGVLVALFGTALTVDLIWIVLFVVFGVYFIYSARVEEKLMLQQFPAKYPDYKARTKMLIPFLF